MLPYQPFDRLPEVLASADVLVVILEPEAGRFSVPSKTLSYLCAGRAVLGSMPATNPAARLLTERASPGSSPSPAIDRHSAPSQPDLRPTKTNAVDSASPDGDSRRPTSPRTS